MNSIERLGEELSQLGIRPWRYTPLTLLEKGISNEYRRS